MSSFPSLSTRQIVKALRRGGFVHAPVRGKGSHRDGLFETYAKSPAAAASRIRVHSKRLDRYLGIGIDSVLLAFAEDKPAAADAAPASGSAAPSHGNLASAVMLMIAVTSAPTPID